MNIFTAKGYGYVGVCGNSCLDTEDIYIILFPKFQTTHLILPHDSILFRR